MCGQTRSTLAGMIAFWRALPNTIWWITVFFAVMAVFTQIAISIGRLGSSDAFMLLAEFVVTVALLCLPVIIAWRGRRDGSLWYGLGALIILAAFWRIYFR